MSRIRQYSIALKILKIEPRLRECAKFGRLDLCAAIRSSSLSEAKNTILRGTL